MNVGDAWYDRCPVCESSDIQTVFKIPFALLRNRSDITKIAPNGYTVQYLPMYGETSKIYSYSACGDCESIFLNPQTMRTKTRYADPQNLGAQFKIDRANLDRSDPGWRAHSRVFERHIRPNIREGTKVLLDAGCGGGQYLILAADDPSLQIDRLIGMELAPKAVEHLKALDFEAYQCDLDEPDSLDVLAPGTVDFVIFAEIFEHVFYPYRTMEKLVTLLRPGGRLFFTAQRNYPGLPVRAGENQCITDYGLKTLIENLKCEQVYAKGMKGGRWIVVIEKR